MMLNPFHVSFALSLALIVGGSTAFAQDEMSGPSAPPAKQKDRKSPKSDDQSATDGGLLSGPAVEVEPEAGRPAGPDGPNQTGKQRRGEQMPLRKWMTALRGVGLSEEQRVEVQAIAKEFQTAAEASLNALTPEERERVRHAMEQRRAGGPQGAGKPGGKPGAKPGAKPGDRAGDKPGEKIDPAMKELMKKVEASRPNPKAYQERIWAVLTSEQQATMKENLTKIETSGGPRGEGQGKRRRPAAQDGQPMPPMTEANTDGQGELEMAPPRKPRDRKSAGPGERERRRAESQHRDQDGNAAGREPSNDEREFKFDEETPAEKTGG